MLRSYQYTEKQPISRNIQNPNFRKKELEIARKYVMLHGCRTDLTKKCPVCGESTGEYFYSKWEIDYLRCLNCRSVYADVDENVARNYQHHDHLLELRLSDEYQKEAIENRHGIWMDSLDWISLRSFRFMRRNKDLNVIDIGNRYKGYVDVIENSGFCSKYDVRGSILFEDEKSIEEGKADVLFYFDQMQKETNPREVMEYIHRQLTDEGILFIGTRAGSGFDILTLKECNEQIFPYEHITMPSVKGITLLLEKCGFEVLEITTPGVMDVKYVLDSKWRLDDREGFVKYLLEESDPAILQEFQRFLQKGCLSSFVRVIARKR